MRPLPSSQAVPDANLTENYHLLNVGDQQTLYAEPIAVSRKASSSFWREQNNRCAFQPPTTYLECLGTTLGDGYTQMHRGFVLSGTRYVGLALHFACSQSGAIGDYARQPIRVWGSRFIFAKPANCPIARLAFFPVCRAI
jgi:hypothetical protein